MISTHLPTGLIFPDVTEFSSAQLAVAQLNSACCIVAHLSSIHGSSPHLGSVQCIAAHLNTIHHRSPQLESQLSSPHVKVSHSVQEIPLQILQLNSVRFGSKAITALILGLRHFPRALRVLSLRDCNIGNAGTISLIFSSVNSLQLILSQHCSGQLKTAQIKSGRD